jgi:uncharacterized membrane protein YqjE
MNDSAAHTGLFGALKGIAATLLVAGKTRLELIGNEIEEEKLRAIQLLLLAQAMAFCLAVGVVLAVGLLTLLLWDSRLLVVGFASVLFLLFGVFFYAQFKRATQRPDRAFAASIAELQEDLRQLKAAVGDESATQ